MKEIAVSCSSGKYGQPRFGTHGYCTVATNVLPFKFIHCRPISFSMIPSDAVTFIVFQSECHRPNFVQDSVTFDGGLFHVSFIPVWLRCVINIRGTVGIQSTEYNHVRDYTSLHVRHYRLIRAMGVFCLCCCWPFYTKLLTG